MKVKTIFAKLYYGDELRPEYVQGDMNFKKIHVSLPKNEVMYWLWQNLDTEENKLYVHSHGPLNQRVNQFCGNKGKCLVQKRLLMEVFEGDIEADYICWFDDDSWPRYPQCESLKEWYEGCVEYLDAFDSVALMGRRRTTFIDKKRKEYFLKNYYKSKHRGFFEQSLQRKKLDFIEGGYYWMRVSALKEIKWPDPNLVHDGEDVALSAALQYAGWNIVNLHNGVRINVGPRRGLSISDRAPFNQMDHGELSGVTGD